MTQLISDRARMWLLPSAFMSCVSAEGEEEPEGEGHAETQGDERCPEVSSGCVGVKR